MPDRTTYELCLAGDSEVDIHDHMMDAIDAASDQNRTTWLTDSGGKRIAKIAPVDEIPDDIIGSWGIAPGQHAFNPEPQDSPAARVQERLRADGAASRLEELGRRLAAKRTETEPAWQAARLDEILGIVQAAARQVEEIHRTLGLERDEDGELVSDTPMLAEVMAGQVETMYHGLGFCGGHGDFEDEIEDGDYDDDDPLGPSWYGKRGEVAARLASGDLIMINRDILLQVLADAGLVEGITGRNRYESVWEALRDLAGGEYPAGTPQQDPGPKMTPGHPITATMLSDVLSLAGIHLSADILATWTYTQRIDAYDWAIREHLNASDSDVARVSRPSFIPVRRTR